MYSIDEKTLQAYNADSREIYVKAIFNNDVIITGDKIKSLTVTDTVGNTDNLSLGNACSKRLEIDMFVSDELTSIASAKIEIEVGIYTGGNIEYTTLGIFYVTDYKTSNDYKSVNITAFDAMLKIQEQLGDTYTCGLTSGNVTPISVIRDICKQAGVSVSIGTATEQKSISYDRIAEGVLYDTSGTRYDSLCSIGTTNLIMIPPKSNLILIKLFGFSQTELTYSKFRAVYFKDIDGRSKYSYRDYNPSNFEDMVDIDDNGNVSQYIEGTLIPPTYEGVLYLGFAFSTSTYDILPDGLYFEITNTFTRYNYVNGSISIPNPQKVEIPARDMIGYMAGVLGCNAIVDRTGVLTVKKIEITPNYIPYNLQFIDGLEKTHESTLQIEYLTTGSSSDENGNGGILTVGSGSYGFNFENPYILKTSVAQNIFNLYRGLEILPCNVNYRGNPFIDAGDIISVQDKNSNCYYVLVLNNTISVTGGLSAKIDSTLKTDVKQDFISVPTSKRLEHKVDGFIAAYQDVINELVGVKGSYVQSVRDTNNVVRALAITQNNIQVTWDDTNGKVVTVNTSDRGTPIWVWSYGGLSFSPNGGTTYEVAINMSGQIYAEMIVGKLSKTVELQSEKGTIGGWVISDDAIYSDFDYDTDTEGYNCYRVYLQNAGATTNTSKSWAISVQRIRKTADGASSGDGVYYVEYNGKCNCLNGLTVSGILKIDTVIRDSNNRIVFHINNDNKYYSYGYGAYTNNYDSYYQGNQVYVRYKQCLQLQEGTTTQFKFEKMGWQFGNESKYIYRNTLTTSGDCVISANNSDGFSIYLVASAIRLMGPTYLPFGASSGTIPLVVNAVGEITTTSSSCRYKENITEDIPEYIDPKGLYLIPVVAYNYKDEYKDRELIAGTQIGITAEDVEKYYPNALIRNADGQAESWQDRIMIPAMLKLIQDQKKEIDTLKRQHNEINERLSNLEVLLTKLHEE